MADHFIPFGYRQRPPSESELEFFRRTGIPGYAADSGQVVLNPFVEAFHPRAAQSVALNEAARLYMRDNGATFPTPPTDEQMQRFVGTPYEGKPDRINETAVARVFSGDSSAGQPTEGQAEMVRRLYGRMMFGLLGE